MADLIKKIEILFDLDRYEDVLKLGYKHLYNSDQNRELIYSYLILSHINLNQFEKALQISDEAVFEYPANSSFIYYRSKALYYLSSYKKALKDIKKVLELEPNNPRYLEFYARVLITQDRFKEAKDVILRALESDAQSSDIKITLVTVLILSDNKKEAQRVLNEVLKEDPNNKEALDIKQRYFTSELKSKGEILKNMLFLDPFDKRVQNEMKFVKYFYIFVPVLMIAVIVSEYFLKNFHKDISIFPVIFVFVGVIGSRDWRLNVPYLATVFALERFYGTKDYDALNSIFFIFFQTLIFHLLFRVFYIVSYYASVYLKEKLRLQKKRGTNVVFYLFFIAPFEKNEEVDEVLLRRYYTIVPFLIVLTLVLLYLYNFYFKYTALKSVVIILFMITSVISMKNFWINIVFVFFSLLIINEFTCKSCSEYFMLSFLISVSLLVPYNLFRRLGWMRD